LIHSVYNKTFSIMFIYARLLIFMDFFNSSWLPIKILSMRDFSFLFWIKGKTTPSKNVLSLKYTNRLNSWQQSLSYFLSFSWLESCYQVLKYSKSISLLLLLIILKTLNKSFVFSNIENSYFETWGILNSFLSPMKSIYLSYLKTLPVFLFSYNVKSLFGIGCVWFTIYYIATPLSFLTYI